MTTAVNDSRQSAVSYRVFHKVKYPFLIFCKTLELYTNFNHFHCFIMNSMTDYVCQITFSQ